MFYVHYQCSDFENVWTTLVKDNNLFKYEKKYFWSKLSFYAINISYFVYILAFWLPFLCIPILKCWVKEDEGHDMENGGQTNLPSQNSKVVDTKLNNEHVPQILGHVN